MSQYYDQASLVMIPSGYKDGKVYSQKPLSASGELTFTRASTATRVNSSGLIESVASGVPRLDYSGDCPSLLLEPQRTNLALYSEQFDDAAWGKDTTTITANAEISPDGTQTSDTMTISTQASRVTQAPSVGSGVWTASVYVKITSQTTSGNVRFLGVVDGSVVNVEFTPTTEWVRYTATFTSSTSITSFQLRGVTSGFVGTIAIWGFQIEAGSYPTSYIPTYDTAVTRLADSCSKTGISSLIGQTEGTLFVEYNSNISEDDSIFIQIDDGTVNNRILLYSNVPNNLATVVFNGSVLQTVIANIPLAVGTNKFAIAYKENDIVLYLNGVQRGSDDIATIPIISAIRMGFDSNFLASASGKGTNQAFVFKTCLSNADLANLTTL
jgi:hypothetical protein